MKSLSSGEMGAESGTLGGPPSTTSSSCLKMSASLSKGYGKRPMASSNCVRIDEAKHVGTRLNICRNEARQMQERG